MTENSINNPVAMENSVMNPATDHIVTVIFPGFGREGGEACVLTEARDLVQTLRSSGEQPIENRRMFSTAGKLCSVSSVQ